MAIQTTTPECTHYKSLEELVPFLQEEKEHIYQVPLQPMLDAKAEINDDQSMGCGSTQLRFTYEGFEQFCRTLGTAHWVVQQTQRKGLATDLLNDRLYELNKHNSFANTELIVDGRDNNIIGIVSNKYTGYSNHTLLRDISNTLSGNNEKQQDMFALDFGQFKIQEAYSYNSRLFLRLLSEHKTGIIRGKGGNGDDITQTGLQISNSMSGGHALKLSYFLHRLVCANGLVVPTGNQSDRVIHTGTATSFSNRVDKAIANIAGSLKNTHTLINRLYGIDFQPHKVVNANLTQDICHLISGRDLRSEIGSEVKLSLWEKEELTAEEIKAKEEEKLINLIMQKLGSSVVHSPWRDNVSMFDFINIFTETANSQENKEKLETQKSAGNLADMIAKNRKKFI